MTSDRFTKATLAIIAVCLLWICVRDVRFLPVAEAQPKREKVSWIGMAAAYDHRFKRMYVFRISAGGEIVRMPNGFINSATKNP